MPSVRRRERKRVSVRQKPFRSLQGKLRVTNKSRVLEHLVRLAMPSMWSPKACGHSGPLFRTGLGLMPQDVRGLKQKGGAMPNRIAGVDTVLLA